MLCLIEWTNYSFGNSHLMTALAKQLKYSCRSDFVYMVPPFLAYYGVMTQNETILNEAYTQISLYRSYLRDSTANNLWKHIQLGQTGIDDGHWSTGVQIPLAITSTWYRSSTGNAWAAAGMIRVLGTIQRSQYAYSFQNQQNNLTNWIREIHGGMYSLIVRLILNFSIELYLIAASG